MQGIREIKRRIQSVKSTQQITRAMKMVAAARLRKAQERVVAARPYAKKMREVFQHVATQKCVLDDPLFQQHLPGNRVCYIVIAGDRGLCGAYNSNVLRKATNHADQLEAAWERDNPEGPKLEFSFVTVGKKAAEFLSFRHYFIVNEFASSSDTPTLDLTRRVADDVCHRFVRGEIDQVYLIYSEFLSVMSQKPTAVKLLPLAQPKSRQEEAAEAAEKAAKEAKAAAAAQAPAETEGTAHKAPVGKVVAVKAKSGLEEAEEEEHGVHLPDYLLEPSAEEIVAKLIPRFIHTIVLQALLEANAGEFGAKMTAMDSATKNADEMISRLGLTYNRARQAGITQELTEIIGGVEALK